MSVLRLFDVSQYIAAGPRSKVVSLGAVKGDDGVYRSNERQCGGISFLLNTVHEYADSETDLVYVFDRPPIYKRRIYEKTFNNPYGYKGNRPKREDNITYQRAFAEIVLQQMGLQTISVEGYEADDCIASLVDMYKDYYDKVYIHSRDSDLYYLVSDNVEVRPVGISGKIVNMVNWEDTVKRGYKMPYNTLILDKLLVGESGDNIPKISNSMADAILNYIPKELYPMCGNNESLRNWVSSATNDDPTVMGTLDLLIPLVVPREYLELYEHEIDTELLEYYSVMFGNKYFRNVTCKHSTLGEETIRQFIEEPETLQTYRSNADKLEIDLL